MLACCSQKLQTDIFAISVFDFLAAVHSFLSEVPSDHELSDDGEVKIFVFNHYLVLLLQIIRFLPILSLFGVRTLNKLEVFLHIFVVDLDVSHDSLLVDVLDLARVNINHDYPIFDDSGNLCVIIALRLDQNEWS